MLGSFFINRRIRDCLFGFSPVDAFGSVSQKAVFSTRGGGILDAEPQRRASEKY